VGRFREGCRNSDPALNGFEPFRAVVELLILAT
jgi:hypothetical protein